MYSLLVLATVAISQVLSMPLSSWTNNKRSEGAVAISCNRPGVFAMTFDDGPYQYSYQLASLLKEKGVRATFFLTGNNWVNVESDSVETEDGQKSYLDVIRHAYAMGHEIASHTYSHKVLRGASEETIREEMNKESDIIYEAIKKRPAIMRPPQGDIGSEEVDILNGLGYTVVNWDLNTNDWQSEDAKVGMQAYEETLKDQSIGHIALEHEVYDYTVKDLVPWAIDYVKGLGLEFVTVSDCLGVEAYQ
ncbi:hypothetical protein BY458DRAFT_479715 [Sporodiniella umbellata]|nr:hypothetical protein BY458DRAFT_479715 [Sporodiniella umbellata]